MMDRFDAIIFLACSIENNYKLGAQSLCNLEELALLLLDILLLDDSLDLRLDVVWWRARLNEYPDALKPN